jgi:archaellum component FlaC
MDKELIAYLDERFRGIDERFRETSQQIQGVREETAQQIQGLREETSRQFQGLREETARQFQGTREETARQIQELREETSHRFDQMEETIRHTDVKLEGLRDDIRQVAEGVAMVDQKLDAFRETVASEFKANRSQVEAYVGNLNRRVRDLEIRASQPGI